MTKARITLLVVLALTLLHERIGLMVNVLLPDVSVSPLLNYGAVVLQSLVLFALPGWLLRPEQGPQAGNDRKIWLWGLVCFCTALIARVVIAPLNGWWAQLLKITPSTIPAADGWMQVVQILALAIVPGIAEELLFRGALLTHLLRHGSRGQAVILTTLLFALMHGSLAGLPGHLIISLLLTLLMVHSGHVAVPAVMHVLYNLLALCWPGTHVALTWVAAAGLAASVIWLVVHMPQGRERRMELPEALLCGVCLLAAIAQYI